MSCAAYLNGEYGLKDVYVGVPAMLGAGRIEKIVEVNLSAEEKNALHTSAEIVKENISKLGV